MLFVLGREWKECLSQTSPHNHPGGGARNAHCGLQVDTLSAKIDTAMLAAGDRLPAASAPAPAAVAGAPASREVDGRRRRIPVGVKRKGSDRVGWSCKRGGRLKRCFDGDGR